MMWLCRHPENQTTRGPYFDYCEDCGAVRESARPGRKQGDWHSCPSCQLPPDMED